MHYWIWVIPFLWVSLGFSEQKPLSILIIGYGGRAQWLLMKCLEQREDLCVKAICDDHAQSCIDHVRQECNGFYLPLKARYEKALSGVELYADSLGEIDQMLRKHADIDLIWI
ncbi:MAG: hypothetical protein HY324_00520, partial [Chlamydiia bacterium]|nr:hypothetical protein [Chlamydiia bacterium]